MDNQNSRPALALPVIPPDFEAKAGTSKTDLVRAIFDLLNGASVVGVNQDQPTPYDLSAIVTKLDETVEDVEDLISRKPRRVTMAGVNNGKVIVPFLDIGTTDYQVDVAFLTPDVNFDPIQWSVIEGSKKTNQVSLRIDGRAGTFTMEITITPLTGVPV